MTETKRYRPIVDRMKVPKELNVCSEEELLAKAKLLLERHEQLMAADSRYRALYESLPDRSEFRSGVPINESVCTPLFTAFNNGLKREMEMKTWQKHGWAITAKEKRERKLARIAEKEKRARLSEMARKK